jgi:acyl-CoA thioester hydrolase
LSKPHEFCFSPRWGELDAFGHVNNVTFLRYFEEARVVWFDDNGWSITELHDTGPVIANVNCDYVKPVFYPASLTVRSWLSRVGNSSFTVEQQLVDAVSGALYARAQFQCVWVDMRTVKPAPVPAMIRLLLLEGESCPN